MKTLLLDTSSFDVVVGLVEHNEIIESKQLVASKQQSELTIPVIDELLNKHGWTLNMVDQVVLTIGPGSYTGVRIAMSIAKTMAVIKPSIKLYSLSTLLAYSGLKENVCTIIDARSNKCFVGYYDKGMAMQADSIVDLNQLEVSHYELNDCTKSIEHLDVVKQMMELKSHWVEVEHVHSLVPKYIKEVEARRLDRGSNTL